MRADSIEVVVRRIVHDVAIPDVNLHHGLAGSARPSQLAPRWRLRMQAAVRHQGRQGQEVEPVHYTVSHCS